MPKDSPQSRPCRIAQLAKIARRDSERVTPTHCLFRHIRIMRAIDSASGLKIPAIPVAGVTRGAWHASRYALLGLAALAAIVIWPAAMHRFGDRTDERAYPPLVTAIEPASASIPRIRLAASTINTRVRDAVEATMVQEQWGGPDQDVKHAAQYLFDQVPFRAAWQSEASNPGLVNP